MSICTGGIGAPINKTRRIAVRPSRRLRLDIAEGADIVMVKPAMTYLDVIAEVAANVDVPVAAYHVSGEYAMLVAARPSAGLIDRGDAIIETLIAIKRAGADLHHHLFRRRGRRAARVAGTLEPAIHRG